MMEEDGMNLTKRVTILIIFAKKYLFLFWDHMPLWIKNSSDISSQKLLALYYFLIGAYRARMAWTGISLQNIVGTIPLFNGSVPFFWHYVTDLIYITGQDLHNLQKLLT